MFAAFVSFLLLLFHFGKLLQDVFHLLLGWVVFLVIELIELLLFLFTHYNQSI